MRLCCGREGNDPPNPFFIFSFPGVQDACRIWTDYRRHIQIRRFPDSIGNGHTDATLASHGADGT